MKEVYIIAMESEAEAVVRHMTDVLTFEECGRTVHQGTLRGESAAVVVCGIGKVNAAAGTQYAIDHFAPERIVNLGVAGGLDPSMKVAEVYSISKCFQCDFDLSEINPAPKGTPNEYDSPFFELEDFFGDSSRGRSEYGEMKSAVVATGDAFSNVDADRDFVYGEMGAGLRDMELAAIAHVCRRVGIPCCALKAVSDLHFPDRPAPTDQYKDNLKQAVDALSEYFKAVHEGFEDIDSRDFSSPDRSYSECPREDRSGDEINVE